MKRKLLRNFTIAATAMALGFGSLASQAKAEETIKIGSFLAVTGGASFLGDPPSKRFNWR